MEVCCQNKQGINKEANSKLYISSDLSYRHSLLPQAVSKEEESDRILNVTGDTYLLLSFGQLHAEAPSLLLNTLSVG